jgi:hypothetical protein
MSLPPFDDVLEALQIRPPITWQLSALQGWIVLTQLQLALRHPHNTGASAQLVRELAQALQDAVAPDGALAALAAAGWDPAQDVPAPGTVCTHCHGTGEDRDEAEGYVRSCQWCGGLGREEHPPPTPLQLTITPTDQLTEMSGAAMRVWDGRTADGVRCVVFVHRLAVPDGEETAAFERALQEQLPPGRVVPLRQIV